MDSEDILITSFKNFNMIDKHHSFDNMHFDVLKILTSYNNFISTIGGNGTTYRLVYEQYIDALKDEIHKGKRVVTMMIGANENKYFTASETDKFYIDKLLERLEIFRNIAGGSGGELSNNLHIINETLKYIHVDKVGSSIPSMANCTINLPYKRNEYISIYPEHLFGDIGLEHTKFYIINKTLKNINILTKYLFNVDRHLHSVMREIESSNCTIRDNEAENNLIDYEDDNNGIGYSDEDEYNSDDYLHKQNDPIFKEIMDKLIYYYLPISDNEKQIITPDETYQLISQVLTIFEFTMDDFIKVYFDKNCEDDDKKMKLIKQIISD